MLKLKNRPKLKLKNKREERYRLLCGDCLSVLPTLAEDSIDAIVTDPPYGLSFMGKGWDHGVPGVEFWVEALRVAKPGAHLLAFGGTRTHHRLAVAIEDAGWEIRDVIMYVYGSGFPKSLNIATTIDKAAKGHPQGSTFGDPESPNSGKFKTQATEGKRSTTDKGQHFGAGPGAFMREKGKKYIRSLVKQALPWQGWGTALKPAWENIIVAQKSSLKTELYVIIENLTRIEAQLWSLLPVKVVKNHLKLSPADYNAACDFAQLSAEEKSNIRDDLLEAMDMSQSVKIIASCLSIVQTWNAILVENLNNMNMFTTKIGTNQTIDLKTLKSCSLALTLPSIIRAEINERGSKLNALPAARYLNAVCLNISSTHELSALENAMSSSLEQCRVGTGLNIRPNWEPIIVARKPLIGTVAENVQRFGTGGLNIDGCSVETTDAYHYDRKGGGPIHKGGENIEIPANSNPLGRWPANLIHDGSEEVLAAFPQVHGAGSARTGSLQPRQQRWCGNVAIAPRARSTGDMFRFGDTGSAARFFYCAKASKADRGTDNNHPTVKPNALMRWLCRLVTPPNGIVLDPFMGSGSTGKAAKLEGFRFIGIELEQDYYGIAQARIKAVSTSDLFCGKVD